MTTFVKTIANDINLFGPQPTNKYAATTTASNAVLYGTGYYGDTGQDLVTLYTKGLSESITLTETMDKRLDKYAVNTMVVTNALAKLPTIGLPATFSVTQAMDKRLDKWFYPTFVVTAAIGKIFDHYVGNTLSVTGNVTAVNKFVGSYAVLFPGGTSNLVSQVGFSYNSSSTSAGTWTTVAYTSTTWS